MECWGAQGGDDYDKTDKSDIGYGGKGGYTQGTLSLTASKKLYVYVGVSGVGLGRSSHSYSNVNVGGYSTGCIGTGGGSTDIRTANGNWYDFNSLKTRIMVAGGGGGAENAAKHGGAAGGTSGYADLSGTYKGGTQTTGYGFGVAQYTITSGTVWGGGGNGYYSGYSSPTTTGAGGGSSFISGHSGCNAIKESSTSSSISHSGSPNHYSGLVFTNTQMKDGKASQTKPAGGTETGHSGHGYARITLTRW